MDPFRDPIPFERHLRAVTGAETHRGHRPWWYEELGIEEPPARHGTDWLDGLVAHAGSPAALRQLDAEPIPDEPFDWTTVEAVDREFVGRVLDLSDACCDALLDVEFRTIARRILARVASSDPRTLRRSKSVERCAAGLVWLAGRGSGEFGRRTPCSVQLLWSWFGVTNCADRGRSLKDAAGLGAPFVERWFSYREMALGDATLLHSRFRAGIIEQRDALIDLDRARKNYSLLEDGRTAQVRTTPVKPVTATKATFGSGRLLLVIGLGTDLDDASFFSLNIPDAHDLVHMVRAALDAPPPGA